VVVAEGQLAAELLEQAGLVVVEMLEQPVEIIRVLLVLQILVAEAGVHH
jgi:hypothetical protein